MQERLQKIIARAGVSSRRAAEELITSGRVRVNGRVVNELGAKADLRDDKVEVDGRRLTAPPPVYIVLHKPRNVVSTMSDPEGRPTVAELLSGVDARVYPVGRLDFATSGVLLATNDGAFSQGMLHPRKGVPKTYVLKVSGRMDGADLEAWETGVQLEDGKTRPAHVHFLRHEEDKTWFEITITEGRNQQLRRMGEATGFPVMRLARLSFAGITSEGLRPGQWRHLTVSELQDLREEFGVPKRVRSAEGAANAGRVFGKIKARGQDRSPRTESRRADDRGVRERAHQRDDAGPPKRTQREEHAAPKRTHRRDSATNERTQRGEHAPAKRTQRRDVETPAKRTRPDEQAPAKRTQRRDNPSIGRSQRSADEAREPRKARARRP
ncbi:MAG: pseudouridine synthase [Polyangiaceae bacterium]|nr:pseudouridine synthase [Polyangiaceae bacterium]